MGIMGPGDSDIEEEKCGECCQPESQCTCFDLQWPTRQEWREIDDDGRDGS